MSLKLKKLKSFHGRKGPVLLIIMDGIGIGPKNESNAVYVARTPNLDRLFGSELYTELRAHGTAVGLPTDKDMGNSEVGHNALGAGRVFEQGALLVNKALETGRVFESDIWKDMPSCENLCSSCIPKAPFLNVPAKHFPPDAPKSAANTLFVSILPPENGGFDKLYCIIIIFKL